MVLSSKSQYSCECGNGLKEQYYLDFKLQMGWNKKEMQVNIR